MNDAIITPSIDLGETVRAVLTGAWRQRWIIAVSLALCSMAGLYHALTATPEYTARASLVIDPRMNTSPIESTSSAPVMVLSDQLLVDSEVKVLASRDLTNRLVERLGLLERNVQPEPPGLIKQVSNAVLGFLEELVGAAPPPVVTDPEVAALRRRESVRRKLTRDLSVSRSGDTYVVDVAFTSGDPVFAATVVNALVDEYFVLQAEAALDNTQRISDWLASRIEVVAEDVAQADAAVEAYREENDLYLAGSEDLPSTMELRVANARLISTRTQLVNLNALIAEIEAAVREGNVNINVPDYSTASLQRLRESLTAARERERELLAGLDPGHALVVRARAEQDDIRALILEELSDIAERLRAQVGTMERELADSGERIEGLQRRESEMEAASIRLRELEREAESKRRLYETILEELNATAEKTTFASTTARVIAAAVPPDRKSAPNRKLILVLSIFAGGVLGGGIAFLREALNDTFLLANDVTDELGLPLIGLTPRITDDLARSKHAQTLGAKAVGLLQGRKRRERSRATFAADNPMSMFAETLRALDMRLFGTGKGPDDIGIVLGFTSARKGEGKSTLSANFAAMKAALGYRVVLIDLDVRGVSLSRLFAGLPKSASLASILDDPNLINRLAPLGALRGAHFIHTDSRRRGLMLADPRVLQSVDEMIGDLRERFDYVVIDLPPLNCLIDANVIAPLTDKMVLGVEWGQARRVEVARLMSQEGVSAAQFVGAIYTKVPLKAYASYNGSAVRDYYSYA